MKILLAVDGSKYSRWAAEWLAEIPFATAPQVKALHVLDTTVWTGPSLFQPLLQPGFQDNRDLIRKEVSRIEQFAKKVHADTATVLSDLGLQPKVLVVKGATAATILKYNPGRGNLIVVGSRGLNPCEQFLMGGVSTRVMNHAPCSVLVVKQSPRPVTRLLLATDGSKPAERALRFLLAELDPVKNSRILEVLVINVIPFMKYAALKEAGEAVVCSAGKKLRQAGYRVKEIVEGGDPAEEILKVSRKKRVDIILTGARGFGAVARFVLGSVSTKLIQHSVCPVLVVR